MSAPYQTSVPAITGRSPTITTTLPAAARVPADSFLVPLYSLPVLGFGFALGSLPLLKIQNHTKTDTPTPNQDLRYPPVHIDRSLTALNLDTLMMRSTTPRDEPRSVLSESNYEIVGLSESLDLTSDDEARTESIASTEGPTPDDASEFSDDDEYSVVNKDLEGSMLSTHADLDNHSYNVQAPLTTEDSTHTEVPAYLERSGEAHHMKLRLDEQPAKSGSFIQGSQVVRSFTKDSSSWFPVFNQYNCSEVQLVVQGAMSQETISTPDTYKIWYTGEPDRWLENKISSQIAAALTACPNTSRSVMVQGQLEPYGPIINTQWCNIVRSPEDTNGPWNLSIVFENGSEVGLSDTVAYEGRPDLVVLTHPTSPRSEADQKDHEYACEALHREGIPCLQLAAARWYGHGSQQYDHRSLVACVEGRNDARADFELQEVLFLDHFTFCELDPMQLNRHLALISPHLLASHNQTGKGSKSSHSWNNHENTSIIRKCLGNKPLLMLLALASIAATFFLNPVLLSYLPRTDIAGVLSTSSSSDLLSSPTITTVVSVTTPTLAVTTPSSLTKSEPRGLTLIPSSPKPAKVKQGKCKNKKKVSEAFRMHRTGTYQFMLVPSEHIANIRNKPQLQIQVQHNNEAVPIRSNRTVDGSYVVHLVNQHSFGSFNVEITSFTKPRIHELFDVMLGHNQSAIARLFDSAKSHLERAHKNLHRATGRADMRLGDMQILARRLSRKVEKVNHNMNIRIHEVKDLVDRQVRSSSSVLKKIPQVAWVGARDFTAPVRTSHSMLNARKNALRLRCQLEMAAGLSSKDATGKQSWACSKITE